MVLIYVLCQKSADAFGLVIGIYLLASFMDTPNCVFMGISLNAQGFAVLALPLMLANTKSKIKIPRWLMHTKSGVKIPKLIGYGFYPLHIFIIYLAKLFII